MKEFSSLKKSGLKILRFTGIILAVFLFLRIAIQIYLTSNHKDILAEVQALTKEKFVGDIAIGDLEILTLKHFPNITIALKDVVVKDSLWEQHKNTLVNSDYVYAKISPWSLLLGDVEIKTVVLKNATIDVHVDSTGYTNFSALTQRKKKAKEVAGKESFFDVEVDQIRLQNVNLISDNELKGKSFGISIHSLIADLKPLSDGWNAKVKLNSHINDLTFKKQNGSFAKDMDLISKLELNYNESEKKILITSEDFNLNNNEFKLDAHFGIQGNSKFEIKIYHPSIVYKEAAKIVSDNIKSKLDKFDLKNPIEVTCTINGDLKVKGTTKIHVLAPVKNNELKGIDQVFTNCSFIGEFTNNYIDNGAFDNFNSAILLHDLKGNLETIPFVTKDVMIFNLKKPIASGSVESTFDIEKLNAFFKDDFLKFTKGSAKFKVKFKSHVVDLKISKPFIEGFVTVEPSDFIYIAKNIHFKNNSIDLEFSSDRLIVNNITLGTEKSSAIIKGYSDNFMEFYYDHPDKIVLNCEVYSKELHLTDLFVLTHRAKPKKAGYIKDNNFLRTALNSQGISAEIKIDRLNHKNFVGKDVIARIDIVNDQIILKEASIKSCNGNLFIRSTIRSGQSDNPFDLHLEAHHVDASELLHSFNNFGSKTISGNTIHGLASLTLNAKGKVWEGKMVENSLKGDLKFQLSKGAFVNFEPIEKIGKYIFHNRDFTNIEIEHLEGNVTIDDGIMKLRPMQVNTSVINFDVGGHYGLNSGTDLEIDVHLRNPKKDEGEVKKEVKEKNRKKGATIHLNLIDDNKGGTKIKLRSKNEQLK